MRGSSKKEVINIDGWLVETNKESEERGKTTGKIKYNKEVKK